MNWFYIIMKYLTFPGAIFHATIEQSACRKARLVVDDNRPLRCNEQCGHIDHELATDRFSAKAICVKPFVINLILGVIMLIPGGLLTFVMQDFRWYNLLLLYFGISLLANLFPTQEDALNMRFFAENGGRLSTFHTASFFKGGAKVESTGLSPIISAAVGVGLTYIIWGIFLLI